MKHVLLLAVASVLLVGCKSPSEMRKEYPTWPAWGWWNKPATPEPADQEDDQPADDTPAVADTGVRPDTGRADTGRPDVTRVSTNTDTRAEMLALDAHRKEVWDTVKNLRDLDEIPLDRRRQLLAKVEENLPAWYRPLDVEPPAPGSKDWTTIVVWDFMPNSQYWHAVRGWQAIAQEKGVPFPQDMTRRKLMQFIQQMTQTP